MPLDNFVTLSSLLKPEALFELFRLSAQAPRGDIVEVGVYKGGSASALWERAQDRDVDLYLYDTFKGIPNATEFDTHVPGDFDDVTEEDIRLMRERMPYAIFVPGVFPETMQAHAKPVGFVHCDCDQYEGVKAVCELFPAKMSPGGIILFDDFMLLEGATKAVLERFVITELTDQNKAVVRVGITKER